ncbi:Sm-like ribonucleo protein [Gonapodya prolifera JEL478]|uniref:Small nuclear ribonucleoprotein E n=1 Tax=Gonapodya prolifera (strain JEL478) TaxID=1344416 RepID=A0A139AEK7_GONPJ|nr:Sm-like ribonucleo protein [Gonapodya prolifera JEL478]|eukprot:KXS15109.1 Sm-like ribonucleo protein [Gonapodya prolifera JEL478]
MGTKLQKVMVQPINLIFKFLQSRQPVHIWLYDQTDMRIEGKIVGFDEFMNIVLDDAAEVSTKKGAKTELGRILLKGDNITLIQLAPSGA